MSELQNKGLTMNEAHKTNSEVDIRSNGTISGFMNRKHNASSDLQINPALSDKDNSKVFFHLKAAVTWLKYCRYGLKLYPINQSI